MLRTLCDLTCPGWTVKRIILRLEIFVKTGIICVALQTGALFSEWRK